MVEVETINKTIDKPIRQRGFKKGVATNPMGRPKGALAANTLLNQALESIRKKRAELHEPCLCVTAHRSPFYLPKPDRKDFKVSEEKEYLASLDQWRSNLWEKSCRTLDEHFARQAFFDNQILVAVQKKRIPDLQHQTGQAPANIKIVMGHTDRMIQVRQDFIPKEVAGVDPD